MDLLHRLTLALLAALCGVAFDPIMADAAGAPDHCASPFRSASVAQPDTITQHEELFIETWPGPLWLIFSDRCREHLLWRVSCESTMCKAEHAGFTMQVAQSGSLRLTRQTSPQARISYLLHGTIADVPRLFTAPIDPLLESYLFDGGHILIEYPDEHVETLSISGFAMVTDLLRTHVNVAPPQEEATIMLRYEALHDPVHADPYVFLPATKPQIQFAIRAQGGVPFAPANLNSTPDGG